MTESDKNAVENYKRRFGKLQFLDGEVLKRENEEIDFILKTRQEAREEGRNEVRREVMENYK